jgi:hypothetical protein
LALENDPGLETIAVKIGREARRSYRGLGGTFASFVYCCLDKKSVPGFHEKGLIAEVKPTGAGLVLCLTGKRSETKLQEVMDIALINAGAYPDTVGKAKFFIEIKSEK